MILDSEHHTILIRALELYQQKIFDCLSISPNANDSTTEATNQIYRYLLQKAEILKTQIAEKKPNVLE